MICRSCLRAKLLAQKSPKPLFNTPSARRNLSAIATSSITSRAASTASSQRYGATWFSPVNHPTSILSRFSSSAPAPAPQSESITPSDESAPEKPDFLDDAESVIWDRLVNEFNPVELVVQDISGGCGSMYGIEISSERFKGATMLKQQRMVNSVLGDLMKGWHGVQLKTRVPQ